MPLFFEKEDSFYNNIIGGTQWKKHLFIAF